MSPPCPHFTHWTFNYNFTSFISTGISPHSSLLLLFHTMTVLKQVIGFTAQFTQTNSGTMPNARTSVVTEVVLIHKTADDQLLKVLLTGFVEYIHSAVPLYLPSTIGFVHLAELFLPPLSRGPRWSIILQKAPNHLLVPLLTEWSDETGTCHGMGVFTQRSDVYVIWAWYWMATQIWNQKHIDT